MANTYTWSVSSIYTLQQPNPNYVVNVFWNLTGFDEINTSVFHGNTKLSIQNNNTFIPYEELTETQIIDWVKTELGLDTILLYQSNLDEQLKNLSNPKQEQQLTSLPWATIEQKFE